MIEILALCWAAEQAEAPAPDAVPPPASLELLEFLGRYEDEEGRFMDPMLLEEPMTPQRPDEEKTHDKPQPDPRDAAAADPQRRR